MARPQRSVWYLGFGLYWSWVYLSFNSLQITGNAPDGAPFIPLLHVVSGLAGVVTFLAVIALRARIDASAHGGAAMWMAAAFTTLGTMFYTLPLAGDTPSMVVAGAVVSGLASPLVALAWGLAYCTLDVRQATELTAGSFLLAGVAYAAIALIPQPVCGAIVTFLPVLSVLALYACQPDRFSQPAERPAARQGGRSEVADLLAHTGNGRVMVGLFLTMFVCGGLRMYIMHVQASVYGEPLLMALPITVVALAFLGYSALVSRTSLNLGPLYRIAMPLFALAFVLVALVGGHTATSFVITSAGSTLIDMLTWVLLIEIVRSTHFSPLLVLATGRLSIHLGMALGELGSLYLADNMDLFFIAAIVILMFTAGYMFLDRDTTFLFEPPTARELDDMPTETPQEQRADTLGARIALVANRYGLSPRETEVFTLWATGHGSRAIEEKLQVSSATVKTHLRHIYEKCDTHSRADILDLLESSDLDDASQNEGRNGTQQ